MKVIIRVTNFYFHHGFTCHHKFLLYKHVFKDGIINFIRESSACSLSKHSSNLKIFPWQSHFPQSGTLTNVKSFCCAVHNYLFLKIIKRHSCNLVSIAEPRMEVDCTKAMLVTANVGSIFEEPETMFPSWMQAFYKSLNLYQPSILAIHCQEVGGKNYEASMQHVNQFIKTLLACDELHKYDRARIFLDEDYTASDKFTALGSLYFIHEQVPNVLIWDFVDPNEEPLSVDNKQANLRLYFAILKDLARAPSVVTEMISNTDCKFIEVEGREVLSGNIENVPIKEKAKFPQHFFPEFKWSRKGFLRTRWSINNCIFDLVNIHLFHDASNIVAMESSPSVYSENRQRALLHTLERFDNDKYSKVPLFVFGDFNFRLDSNLLIQELTNTLVAKQSRGKKNQVNKIEYTEEGNGKVLLTVGSKSFDYYEKHTDLFAKMNKWLRQYDTEFSAYRDQLMEFDINFPPSYPFCEDIKDGISYMKTRVPSWCDRVLLTHSAWDIIVQDQSHPVVYDLMGKDSCMGDHKPVYLFLHIKPGKGKTAPSTPLASHTTSEPGRLRSRTLSINGELVDNGDLNTVNIHDFAIFEQEQNLLEEFKESIKNRPMKESDVEVISIEIKRSFQEVAQSVRTMEKVLRHWPKRPLDRHHSSSSEDYPSDESDRLSTLTGDSVDHNKNSRTKDDIEVTVASEQEVRVPGERGCGDQGGGMESVVLLTEHEAPQSGGDQLGKIDDTPASAFFAGCSPTPKAELSALPGTSDIIIPSTQVKISEVDTTRYIHIRQGESSTRVFRETSV